jgi:rubredoxin
MARPEAGILAPGLFRRAFPRKRCFPVASEPRCRLGCDGRSRSQWRDRAGFTPASLPPTCGAVYRRTKGDEQPARCAATPEQLASLHEKTERYCTVMQTLNDPPAIATEMAPAGQGRGSP